MRRLCLIFTSLLLVSANALAQQQQIAAAMRAWHWVRLAQNNQRALYYSGDHLSPWKSSDGKLYAATYFRTDVIGAVGQSLLISIDTVLVPCFTDNPASFTVMTTTELKGDWTPTNDLSDEADAKRSYEVPIAPGSTMIDVAHTLCHTVLTAP